MYGDDTDFATQDDAVAGSNRDQGSNSLSGFLSTLVPNLIIAAIFIALFLIFRPKFARVYAPRTYVNSLGDQYVSPHNQKLLPHHFSTTRTGNLLILLQTQDSRSQQRFIRLGN